MHADAAKDFGQAPIERQKKLAIAFRRDHVHQAVADGDELDPYTAGRLAPVQPLGRLDHDGRHAVEYPPAAFRFVHQVIEQILPEQSMGGIQHALPVDEPLDTSLSLFDPVELGQQVPKNGRVSRSGGSSRSAASAERHRWAQLGQLSAA